VLGRQHRIEADEALAPLEHVDALGFSIASALAGEVERVAAGIRVDADITVEIDAVGALDQEQRIVLVLLDQDIVPRSDLRDLDDRKRD